MEFLRRRGYREEVRRHLPIRLHSPNAIEPAQMFTAFLVSVLAGGRRFAHAGMLRADRAVHALLGLELFPTDDTMRNLFKRFRQRMVYEFFEPLWAWQLERLPRRQEGYSLDLDSTVFERYGQQERAHRGYNPKKHGRASHHPPLAVLAEAQFILHGWLRSGNSSADSGGAGRCGILRRGFAALSGSPRLGLHRGGPDDAFAETRSG